MSCVVSGSVKTGKFYGGISLKYPLKLKTPLNFIDDLLCAQLHIGVSSYVKIFL